MATLYPWGYQRSLVEMPRLQELARKDLMEPEYAERLFPWLESRGGEIGIGGAFRITQPDKPGFAPDGRSFHQKQVFDDDGEGFMAVDLVVRNGENVHRAPRWSEVPQQGTTHPDIRDFGLHCNVPGEPWHMQAIEVDGHAGWVTRGRPHPNPDFPVKGMEPPPPPPPAPEPTPDGPYPPGARTLRVTTPLMQGIDVAYVQQTLTRQGLKLDDDGVYGQKTADAVKTMQGWNNLTADGVLGPQTWPVLIAYNDPPKPPPDPNYHEIGSRTLKVTSPTMQGSDVLWVQNVIRNQGVGVSIDGYYGKQTADRVKLVQGWNNLEQDGVVGPKTWDALKRY